MRRIIVRARRTRHHQHRLQLTQRLHQLIRKSRRGLHLRNAPMHRRSLLKLHRCRSLIALCLQRCNPRAAACLQKCEHLLTFRTVLRIAASLLTRRQALLHLAINATRIIHRRMQFHVASANQKQLLHRLAIPLGCQPRSERPKRRLQRTTPQMVRHINSRIRILGRKPNRERRRQPHPLPRLIRTKRQVHRAIQQQQRLKFAACLTPRNPRNPIAQI